MKKGRVEVVVTSKDEMLITNEMSGGSLKGCASAGWKEEMVNQRCIDLLRYMLGRV